jgi:hypothetical protein
LGRQTACFSFDQIKTAVAAHQLGISEASLKVYLSEAIKTAVIHDAGRGWYSCRAEPVKLDPQPLHKLVRTVKKAFPLLDFCAWSTAQLNPWMHHLIARPVAFLYVARDALDSVGEALRERGWDVAVNPGNRDAARVVRPDEKMVVLRPAHSKQPPAVEHLAAPEQVMVELLEEADALSLMDSSEAKEAVLRVAASGRFLVPVFKRFADFKRVDIADLWPINQRHTSEKSAIS